MAAEIQKDRLVLGNDFLSAAFTLEKGRLTSFSLTNVLTGKTLAPEKGSELFELRFAGVLSGETVRAGELKVQSALPAEDAQGSGLKIFFKPFRVRACKVELQYAVLLGRTDAFLTAHLEMRLSGGEKALLEFIDLAPVCVRPEEKTGGVRLSEKKKEVVPASLGQPVFWEHAFFGCTFPGALNAVFENRLCARRYYGRSLAELCGADGVFVSDSAVWGVGARNDPVTMRKAFLRYLEKTLPPVQTQHLLWFPTSPLTEDAVHTLFEEEKRMQSGGVPFFGAVLLDKRQIFPEDAPFAFSDQIPQRLRNFGAAAAALGASLGLAVGLPREAKGLFRRREPDVCLANETLLASFRDFVLSLAQKCGVTDWQIHLPLEKPCRNKAHGHPVGGDRQMFYYSDLLEKWINLFCLLKKTAGVPLRISLCGAYSPWLLQWADALGLPAKLQTAGSDARGILYHDLACAGVCVPNERLFDPLPQKGADFPCTAAKRTLTLCGAADPTALRRQQKQQTDFRGLLAHTLPIDAPRETACCAFAAFDSGEGLLTLCNPTANPADVALTLDETLGVPQRFLSVGVSELWPKPAFCGQTPLRFGDHLTQTLAPHETRVLHLGTRKAPPVLLSAVAADSTTLRLRFDKPVEFSAAVCERNTVQAVVPDPDGYGAAVQMTYPFAAQNNLRFTGVRDLFGNEITANAAFLFSENGLLPLGALYGTGAFSVKVTFGSEANLQMYLQTQRLLLAAEDGHITFRVGDAVLRSRSRTDNLVQVCAVREQSGTLKLYLNGKLEQSLQPLTEPCALVPAAALCFDEKRTKLFARALSFDEV